MSCRSPALQRLSHGSTRRHCGRRSSRRWVTWLCCVTCATSTRPASRTGSWHRCWRSSPIRVRWPGRGSSRSGSCRRTRRHPSLRWGPVLEKALNLSLSNLPKLGFEWEANDFFYFIADVAAGEENLQVMYGARRRARARRVTLDHLEGYERAHPVRIGNAAYKQEQHDVWGALLDSVYLHTAPRDSLDDRVWPILQRQVEQAIENWREPDRGIWEVRGEPKHFTSSKVFCWVACDRGARLAELREDFDRAQPLARGGRRDQGRRPRQRRRRARRVRAALRHRRARRRAAAAAADALPAARRRAHPRHGVRDRRRADRARAWSCATAPRRPTTAWRARRARS